jgi:hypothetical protein
MMLQKKRGIVEQPKEMMAVTKNKETLFSM